MTRTRKNKRRTKRKRHSRRTCRRRSCEPCLMGGKRKSYGLILKDAFVPALMVSANNKYPAMTKVRKKLRRLGLKFKNTKLRRSSFSIKRKKKRRRRTKKRSRKR